MCGLTGFLSFALSDPNVLRARVAGMASALRHRGPDDEGMWIDPSATLALGHRRLSIVDLSPAGHQPMLATSGRYVVVYNGEIYNHLEIRAEIERTVPGAQWRGHSDTETLLAAIDAWGLEAALTRAVGMFALALWDIQERTLFLARDRFGEKPLYYGWVGRGEQRAFAFGSELKALRAYPEFANDICREALTQYMRFLYVPAPRSIYKGIYKLEPGCMLVLRGSAPLTPPPSPLRGGDEYGTISVRRWWSLASLVENGAKNFIQEKETGVDMLEAALGRAVREQSLADVPLGAFLSGGVDSSAVVALMQQHSVQPVKTFTIGFEEKAYDESDHARAVAHHLGTLHTELFVSASDAREVIPLLPTMYDEPFADSSQIPTFLVCRAARRHVTVALSGDAGDELFGGYNRYFWAPRIWDRLAWLPYSVRRAVCSAISSIPARTWDAMGAPLNAMLPGGRGIARVGDKAHKLAARLRDVRTIDDFYRSLVSEWQDPASVVVGEDGKPAVEPRSALYDTLAETGMEQPQLRMMYRDAVTYLPDDILCKVDRAAMATSLETRVPYLDHRVAELAWRMPVDMKIRGNEGKWALRQVLYRHVPRALIDRPKDGFGIPVGRWLAGELAEWADDLLSAYGLRQSGFFCPEQVGARWREHRLGRQDHTLSLWAVLMFESWYAAQRRDGPLHDEPTSERAVPQTTETGTGGTK